MRYQFIIWLFLFLSNSQIIWPSEVDSLLTLANYAKEDNKAAIYNELGYFYAINHSIDTAFIYTNKAYALASKYKNLEELGNAMHNYGCLYRFKSDFNNEIKYKSKAAEYYLQAKNLKLYAICLNDIGCGYHALENQEKAFEFHYKAYKINAKYNFTKELAKNLNNIGDLYYDATDYQNAINYFRKIFCIPDQSKLVETIPYTYTNIGNVYGIWGKHDSAIIYYQKALNLIENTNKKDLKASLYNNIGYEYKLWNKHNKALEFFNLALKMDLEISYDINIVSDYNNIGLCYMNQNDYKLAEEYFQKEYNLAVKIKQPYYKAMALGNLSQVKHKEGKFKEAMLLISQELDIINKNKLAQLKGKAFQMKGYISCDMGDYPGAIDDYRKSLGIVLPSGDKEVIMNNYKLMSDAFKAYGNSDSALKYFKLYTQVKDSVFTKEQHNSLAEYEVKFGLKQKENQIAVLKMDVFTMIEKLKQQKSWLFIMLAGLVFILLLTFTIYRKYRINKKINQLLKEQHDTLSVQLKKLEQHKTVTKKYESSILTTDDIEEIFVKLLNTFNQFSIYLNPDITLPWLAEKLDVLPNNLSQVINQKTNQNFNDFINYYRINEAKGRLINNKYGNFTIEAIGKSVGFNSKTTFINAFKKFEQTYPSKYKKQHSDNQ